MMKFRSSLYLLSGGILWLLAAQHVAAEATLDEPLLPSAPLVLEFRYCECQVVLFDQAQWTLAPNFLEVTELSQANVALQQNGRVVTPTFFADYRLDQSSDDPDAILLSYTINMDSGASGANARASAHARVALAEWTPLLIASHQSYDAPYHFNVVARIIHRPDTPQKPEIPAIPAIEPIPLLPEPPGE